MCKWSSSCYMFINRVSIIVFLLFVVGETMEVTGWLLLVICITLGISPLCVVLSELPNPFILALLLRYGTRDVVIILNAKLNGLGCYVNLLVLQLESLSVSFLYEDELPADLSEDFDILVDAMFGFSFHGKHLILVLFFSILSTSCLCFYSCCCNDIVITTSL